MTLPLSHTCRNCNHSEGNLHLGILNTRCHLSRKRVHSTMAACTLWTPLNPPHPNPAPLPHYKETQNDHR